MTKLRRALGYCRVSSDEQREEGVSLSVQEAAIYGYAKSINCHIAPEDMFVVAESASKAGTRPKFLEMLRRAHDEPGTVLIFDRVDRSARNPLDTAILMDRAKEGLIEVHFVKERLDTSTAHGRMVWNTLAGSATYETDGRATEIKRSRQRLSQQGAFLNCPPYGYRRHRIDGIPSLAPDGENSEAVRRAFDLFAFGPNLTVQAIANRLHEEGFVYKAPKNPKFSKQALSYILKNRVYLGMVRGDSGGWVPGAHEALVDRPTFERAQERFRPPKRTKQEHLFGSCVVTCGVCGRAVTCEAKHNKTKNGPVVYRYYRCADQTREGSRRPYRQREEELEAHVREFFRTIRFESEDMRALFADVLRRKTIEAQKSARQRIARIKKRLTEVQEHRRRAVLLRMANEIREADLAIEQEHADHEESVLLSQLKAESRADSGEGHTAAKAFLLSQALEERWVRANLASKRLILSLVSLNLVLRPGSLEIEARAPFGLLVQGAEERSDRSERN
ncbi:MAG: recombinase family protein [Planctomycetota bacterium]